MTANKPKWWQWLFKMDAFGNYPELWQWGFPRYGKWGGPGWSGGRWCKDPSETDRDVPPDDPMDAEFRDHDLMYQDGEVWAGADLCMVMGLHKVAQPNSFYGRLYRYGAIIVFSVNVFYMMITGRFRYLKLLKKGESQ